MSAFFAHGIFYKTVAEKVRIFYKTDAQKFKYKTADARIFWT